LLHAKKESTAGDIGYNTWRVHIFLPQRQAKIFNVG